MKTTSEVFLGSAYGRPQDEAMTPQRGTRVQVRNAYDETVTMVALGPPRAGQDFPVVLVCSVDEFERANAAGEEPAAIAWPLDAVLTPV